MACSPTGANNCSLGYYCGPNGTCTADCAPGSLACPQGQMCTSDGHCIPGSGGPDTNCPNVHLTASHTTPSVELLIDRSGSMGMNDILPTRYDALHTALTGTNGAVTQTQGSVYFGAALFSGDEITCPPGSNLDGYSVPRALNNASAIDTLISNNSPGGDTPTAEWITAITADWAAHPPPMGSPPITLLSTDGEPNSCSDPTPNDPPSIAAAQASYAAGIKLYIIGLAGLNLQFLQDMANAGTGKPTGQAPGCATCSPYYTANDPTSLAAAFQAIIGGVLSCDLTLSGMVDPSQANQGIVTLNGMMLTYGTDWTLDPNGMVIHLSAAACDMLKNSPNPTVDAQFPCGAVIQ